MTTIEIACDESGSEGENLISSGQPIFVHASTDLGLNEAARLIAEARRITGSTAVELKSHLFVGKTKVDRGRWFLDALSGRGAVNLTDKRYFVVGKMVDLLIEPEMDARGEDLYRFGRAHKTAQLLYRLGPSIGSEAWDDLLNAFNRLVQIDRSGAAVGRSDDFFVKVQLAHSAADKGMLRHILGLLLTARTFGDDLENNDIYPAHRILDMDPLMATIGQSARRWNSVTSRDIAIVHDNTSALTPERIRIIIDGLSDPRSPLALYAPPVPLVSITLVDSVLDERIQVADILAGIANEVSNTALRGNMHPLTNSVREYVDPLSLWEDDASWNMLCGDESIR